MIMWKSILKKYKIYF